MPFHHSNDTGVHLLTLDYAPMNTLDINAVKELTALFTNVASQQQPVVITGTDRAFSAGVNTRAFEASSGAERAELVLGITRMTAALMTIQAPLVAAINGHALGGGFVIMLCADYRLVVNNEKARFGITEAKAGVPFPAGARAIIKHEMDAAVLRRWGLTSQTVDSAALLESGLVDELVDSTELQHRALAVAAEIAEQPAFVTVKQQVRGELTEALKQLAISGEDPLANSLRLLDRG